MAVVLAVSLAVVVLGSAAAYLCGLALSDRAEPLRYRILVRLGLRTREQPTSRPIEVIAMLLPPGMIGVIREGDDGYGGLLGWMWVVSALTTIVLVYVTRLALREKYYSAVMAATGLLYLAILTAFGTDVVARALLAP